MSVSGHAFTLREETARKHRTSVGEAGFTGDVRPAYWKGMGWGGGVTRNPAPILTCVQSLQYQENSPQETWRAILHRGHTHGQPRCAKREREARRRERRDYREFRFGNTRPSLSALHVGAAVSAVGFVRSISESETRNGPQYPH